MNLTLYATDLETGIRESITDLYWFEEEGVHDWSGEAHSPRAYRLEVWIDGTLVFDNQAPQARWQAWNPA